MRVGIIDADLIDNGTRHPNLALMKIAGYHIELGDEVSLIYTSYDEVKNYNKVYISKVFNFTKVPEWVINEGNVEYGGTGFFEDGGKNLPDIIEHHMPYYDLYSEYIDKKIASGKDRSDYSDYLDYSIGFITRGCFRKCEFCVNRKYDKAVRHSSVQEFLCEDRPRIYLWDDNFLDYSRWEEALDELIATKKPFQFRQGLDLRLMTDKKANRLNNVRYHGDFIFAFDNLDEKEEIISKVQLWKKYTNKQPKMYVLSGFESQDAKNIEGVFERISILMRYGSVPYIMRYEKCKTSKYKGMYIQIARWCNQPQFYKKMSFREFCERNQYYNTNKNILCSSYKAMLDFERENTEIAQKYFDIKFMNDNIYKFNYGYGRKYCNKPECYLCQSKQKCWDYLINNSMSSRILELYMNKELDVCCLKYSNSECSIYVENAAKKLVNILLNANKKQIEYVLLDDNYLLDLSVGNGILPEHEWIYYNNLFNKISEYKDEYIIVKDLLETFKSRTLINDLKVLAMADLIVFSKTNISGKVSLSPLGSEYRELSDDQKFIIWELNLYRFPVMKYYILNDKSIEKIEDKLIEIGLKSQELIKHIDNINY